MKPTWVLKLQGTCKVSECMSSQSASSPLKPVHSECDTVYKLSSEQTPAALLHTMSDKGWCPSVVSNHWNLWQSIQKKRQFHHSLNMRLPYRLYCSPVTFIRNEAFVSIVSPFPVAWIKAEPQISWCCIKSTLSCQTEWVFSLFIYLFFADTTMSHRFSFCAVFKKINFCYCLNKI